MQAEALRQVRQSRALGEGRLGGVREAGQVQDGGQGRVPLPCLSRAPSCQSARRMEEAWASFQEQSGVLQVPPSPPPTPPRPPLRPFPGAAAACSPALPKSSRV